MKTFYKNGWFKITAGLGYKMHIVVNTGTQIYNEFVKFSSTNYTVKYSEAIEFCKSKID